MAVGKSLHAVGQLLSGTYQIERKIAEGGMGVVYLASHTRLPRKFAIKLLGRPEEGADQTVALERFKREAQVASALKNPHVVQIYDYQISEAGFPFIVMELLEGEDLARRIKKGGRMPPGEALRILGQIADALDAAHELGIIHRDLKPANIFLNTTPEPDFVKVLDFGVSKMLEWETITRTDMLVGTPLYMSPEQAGGGQDISTLSDIFAFGAMAYELLTGGRPFTGQSIPAILYQVVHADPAPASKVLGPRVTAVDAVFAQALAKAPEMRHQSAAALVRDLRRALEPILPKVAPPDRRFPTEPSSQNTVVRLDGERGQSAWPSAAANEETKQTRTPVSSSRPGAARSGPSGSSGDPLPRSGAPGSLGDPLALARSGLSASSGDPFGPLRGSPASSMGAYGELALATPIPTPMPAAPRRLETSQLLVIAAALVLIASAVTVSLRRGRARDARQAVGSVQAPEDPRAELAPPRQVRIGVRTDPKDARVLLDDVPIEGGTVTLEWRSVPRRLRVSAPGYLTVERAVDATLDRDLDVTLEREGEGARPPRVDRPTKGPAHTRPPTVRAPVLPPAVRPAPPPTGRTTSQPERRPPTGLVAPVQDL